MDTVILNEDVTGIIIGDDADKIRYLWPMLKERLNVAMDARPNRSVKANAALLYDYGGEWLSCIAFHGWSQDDADKAICKLAMQTHNVVRDTCLLIWAHDDTVANWDVHDMYHTTCLVHGDRRLEDRLAEVQSECERAMGDELNRHLPTIGPLRLSVLVVRDFNAQTGDAWQDVFPSLQQWSEVAPFLTAMSLCEADGVAFREADHPDRLFCLGTLEDAARMGDLIHPADETWLMDRYNTHVMCADLATAARIGAALKGKRETCLYDVHVIQTAHVNLDLKQRMTFQAGQLTQGKVAMWLVQERPLGITMAHYTYKDVVAPVLVDENVIDEEPENPVPVV